jgi:hypothetical protein
VGAAERAPRYGADVFELGQRLRSQPAPPHVVYEALTQPRRPSGRVWLHLLADEREPEVVDLEPPTSLTWSSLWPRRAGLLIRFDLRRAGDETDLVWTLRSPTPVEDPSGVGHMRKRLNEIINRDLRYGFGQ